MRIKNNREIVHDYIFFLVLMTTKVANYSGSG
nr:MAG TPA: Bcl-2-like protein [Caudoviricetes sp.]